MGSYPVTPPVVLLGLLLHTFLQHPLDLLLGEAQVFQRLFLIPVGVVGQHLGPVQPVQQLLRHLLLEGHVLKILQKAAVEGVKVRLAFHQKTAAQVVKARETGAVEPLVHGFHQGHPLSEGHL